MNKKILFFGFLFFCLWGWGNFIPLTAQVTDNVTVSIELSRVTLMDIEPNNDVVSLPLTAPTKAGLPAQGATNNVKWLNYTCCLESGDSDRSITVNIGNGSVPPGLQLTVKASAYSGNGSGTFGNAAGTVTLSSTAQTLISGIRGAFTGNGLNNGHQLIYQLQITDYSKLDFDQSNTVQVVYTIVD